MVAYGALKSNRGLLYARFGGEVAERLKAPLSKSGIPFRDRGFESHPLRHYLRRGAGVVEQARLESA